MTKEEFAKMIDGREYPFYLTPEEQSLASDNHLLVVSGFSDDTVVFEGAAKVEMGVPDGGFFYVSRSGCVYKGPTLDELTILKKFGFAAKDIGGPGAFVIEATGIGGLQQHKTELPWRFETTAPCSTFEIVKDGGPCSCGIVIDLAEVRRAR